MATRVVVATDGSLESLEAARALPGLLDAAHVEEVLVVAVLSPTAAVPFRDEIGSAGRPSPGPDPTSPSYRQEAESAVAVVAAALEGWAARVRTQVRSGSAAAEIVEAAEEFRGDLIVLASGSKGLTKTVLLGSTALRVQHSAPCSVLVWRPTRT
ncbi:Nucleotide-binding universal stress protein, UspA family [Quadrisphaera granulorum]|uniref:Nucleotide-binding universal stress UspA family protein n=1 Tax=Quadrisphaera granulorum TaxID=317664 RepID=A0A316AHB7_9ACTN|nr:universal stress protein [Quadrisphaera granulorum]PWJ56330.1 nucleotide-binding universal stress UspA family protein [Quadrisphaera granulorum]SZE94964.1 Nucleotide-binding universal stress protein, UspA family [Quadrisphaera granulorum]